MEVKAVEKYIRISPKKARLVADIVRGQNAKKALVTLRFTQKKAAKIIYKAVKSAVANAENNFNIESEKLVIKSISVDGGPSLKRIQPVSKGMAHAILKRTSHITVIVSDEQINDPKSSTKKVKEKTEENKVEKIDTIGKGGKETKHKEKRNGKEKNEKPETKEIK